MELDDFEPGMRVQTKELHQGPSFPRAGGYVKQLGKQVWRGTVVRIGRMAGVVWVQWDDQRPGRTHPVQADMLVREGARLLNLD